MIEEITVEHQDELSFNWLQRNAAVNAPNYSPEQFADLEERLEAHIDGLRVAAEEGWKIAESALDNEGPEDFFPAAILALEILDNRFDNLVEKSVQLPEVLPALMAALGWVSPEVLAYRVKALLTAKSPTKQKLGLAACGYHRRDPGDNLAGFLSSPVDSVRVRALRVVGELGRIDLLPQVQLALDESKPELRYWAARSAILLGDQAKAVRVLLDIAGEAGRRQMPALQLALQAIPAQDGHNMLANLANSPNTTRLCIFGAGFVGIKHYIPWLIEQMVIPEFARIAAEAFVNITGADFNMNELEAMPPDDFEDGPTDDPDDEVVELPEDVALPWPNIEKLKNWWDKNDPNFKADLRYFLGQQVTQEHCVAVLKQGFQRQRVCAAQYLCLLKPGSQLFPTSAPWRRQKQLLEQLI